MAERRTTARRTPRSKGKPRRPAARPHFIARAIKRPGALRRKLGIKKGETIPVSELRPKRGDTTLTKQEKRFALQLREWSRKRRKRVKGDT